MYNFGNVEINKLPCMHRSDIASAWLMKKAEDQYPEGDRPKRSTAGREHWDTRAEVNGESSSALILGMTYLIRHQSYCIWTALTPYQDLSAKRTEYIQYILTPVSMK